MFLNSGKQNKQINKKNTSFKNNFQWPVKNFPRSAQWTECKNTVKVSCKSFPYPTTSEATGQSPFFESYIVYMLRLKIFT